MSYSICNTKKKFRINVLFLFQKQSDTYENENTISEVCDKHYGFPIFYDNYYIFIPK